MQTPDGSIVATLQAHEPELRAAGIRALSLFGSVARGDDRPESDVDLVVRLDPEAHLGLFRFIALERRLGALLGRPVQLLPEPVESPRLRANLERDRRRVF
jgi:predicted nucleotidyltransferase